MIFVDGANYLPYGNFIIIFYRKVQMQISINCTITVHNYSEVTITAAERSRTYNYALFY